MHSCVCLRVYIGSSVAYVMSLFLNRVYKVQCGRRVANTSGTETDTQASATCFQACSRPAPSGQDNAAAGAPARGMCSNDVHLTVLRRCGTDVAGLWVSGGALLRSVEEQHRLYVESTVRRASPCTTSCCPLLCEPSPCSSTHPCTPARTIALSGCVHSRAHI